MHYCILGLKYPKDHHLLKFWDSVKCVFETSFSVFSGMAHMVYPGAVHSRFEHSLGVYWLAGEAAHKLKTHQVWNLHTLLI